MRNVSSELEKIRRQVIFNRADGSVVTDERRENLSVETERRCSILTETQGAKRHKPPMRRVARQRRS